MRGCAKDKCNKIEEAIDDFSKVLELKPKHVNARLARASCLNKMGE